MKKNDLKKNITLFFIFQFFLCISCGVDVNSSQDIIKGYTKVEWKDGQTLSSFPDKFYFEYYFSTINGADGRIVFDDTSVWEFKTYADLGKNSIRFFYPRLADSLMTSLSFEDDDASDKHLIGFRNNYYYEFKIYNSDAHPNTGYFLFSKSGTNYKDAEYKF